MSDPLTFDRVWKSYPRWTPGTRTLKGLVARRLPALGRLREQRWALRDVSFSVPRGSGVGLVGHNGAGKSTLLRLASGLGRPTHGRIAVGGRPAAVLSLGTSFDLSLTGRENAVTAAVIAGVRERQARALLPSILEFAELEDYADAPVRTYSDGMKLRLAFGVVAQLQPDVLLLDEVIAVGDLRFQARCLERVREMRESGTTMLLASHSLDQVASECDRAIWLHAGAMRAQGDALEVVGEYRDAMLSATVERTPAAPAGAEGELELRRNRLGSQELTIEEVVLAGADGRPVTEIVTGGSLTVRMTLAAHASVPGDPIVAVSIQRVRDSAVCLDSNTLADGVRVGRVEDGRVVSITYERLDLLPGDYAVEVGVYRPDWEYAYDTHLQAYPLRVVGRGEALGIFRAPHHWGVGA
ncbi:MAG TPA: ABC transporter ATP-binding protein [Solirubrobacteraceae bacterium]|nr:ABC transporter ATP-binding protein [Solirubrobacteraceae bacterium]